MSDLYDDCQSSSPRRFRVPVPTRWKTGFLDLPETPPFSIDQALRDTLPEC
jgi:hypothetical protein